MKSNVPIPNHHEVVVSQGAAEHNAQRGQRARYPQLPQRLENTLVIIFLHKHIPSVAPKVAWRIRQNRHVAKVVIDMNAKNNGTQTAQSIDDTRDD